MGIPHGVSPCSTEPQGREPKGRCIRRQPAVQQQSHLCQTVAVFLAAEKGVSWPQKTQKTLSQIVILLGKMVVFEYVLLGKNGGF